MGTELKFMPVQMRRSINTDKEKIGKACEAHRALKELRKVKMALALDQQ